MHLSRLTLNPRTRRVQRELADALTLRIPVQVVEPGALPRFEFKSQRWIRG